MITRLAEELGANMSMSSTASSSLPPLGSAPVLYPTETSTPSERPGRLLERLALELETQRIGYCQWQGAWSPVGDGAVDLLVADEAISRFRSLVQDLGFKPVAAAAERQIPGVESYVGHDPVVARVIRLHVRYRLLIGDYWRTVYRLPIERPLLESTQPAELFRVPAPPYQFLIYVLRMMLRLRGWPLPLREARWLIGIQGQLDYLDARSDRDALGAILAEHLPGLDLQFLDHCLHALRRESDPAESAAHRRELHRKLTANARNPSIMAVLVACGEKILPRLLQPMLSDGRVRSSRGGVMVAVSDGGRTDTSTWGRELCAWLADDMPTFHAHFARPTRSLLTLLVEGALEAERLGYRLLRRTPPSRTYVELVRHLCTARDRYLGFKRARRYAVAGGIAICEQYPHSQNCASAAPCISELIGSEPTIVARWLRDAERRYYARIQLPDTVFVLRADPDRDPAGGNTGEAADLVTPTVGADWGRTPAQVIDASRQPDVVLQDLKAQLWSVL